MNRKALTDAERSAKRRERLKYQGYRAITVYLEPGPAGQLQLLTDKTGWTQSKVIGQALLEYRID